MWKAYFTCIFVVLDVITINRWERGKTGRNSHIEIVHCCLKDMLLSEINELQQVLVHLKQEIGWKSC